ncbi:hypothetical protein [Vibrio alginolyticus]|uniref:hypothetical protein n=1 Tax=Vibrio alginolyticus TaxID=663 RepID=UPI001BD49AB6|nr:hypothetical protein [Vibrio alginolyticus]MBS9921584.1 hypothetical protein [Vibrio alginolyticus]
MDLDAKLKKLKDEQIKLAEEYQSKQSYELAYIAYWSVVEHFSKEVGEIFLKQQLEKKLVEWQDYLSGKQESRPQGKQISLKLECSTIPPMNQLTDLLGELPKTANLLKSKSKYRNRRNDIAHRATKFGKEQTFFEYKEAVIGSIEELELAVSQSLEGDR